MPPAPGEGYRPILPYYWRFLRRWDVGDGFMNESLEADLRYKLQHSDKLRGDPQFRKAVYQLNQRNGGVTTFIVDVQKYGRLFFGEGTTTDEEDFIRAELDKFQDHLVGKLQAAQLDFYHRDGEAPPGELAVLTGLHDERAIGVRVD